MGRLDKIRLTLNGVNPHFKNNQSLQYTWTAREICDVIGDTESKFVSSLLHKNSDFLKLPKRECAITKKIVTSYTSKQTSQSKASKNNNNSTPSKSKSKVQAKPKATQTQTKAVQALTGQPVSTNQAKAAKVAAKMQAAQAKAAKAAAKMQAAQAKAQAKAAKAAAKMQAAQAKAQAKAAKAAAKAARAAGKAQARPRPKPIDPKAEARRRMIEEQLRQRAARAAVLAEENAKKSARTTFQKLTGYLGNRFDEAKAAYRRKALALHPDRGGDNAEMSALSAAWSAAQSTYN